MRPCHFFKNWRLNMKKNNLVLAVSSSGGHWEQLTLLKGAFGPNVQYVTTMAGLGHNFGISPTIVPDCNRNQPLNSMWCAVKLFSIVLSRRPRVVITTGAAPGLFAVVFGKIFGAKTVWLDSVANSERLSLSGKLAGIFVDVWLTQWSHLAKSDGPAYEGRVL